jgi:hypothetical protein
MMLDQPQCVASKARHFLLPRHLRARLVVRDELPAGIEILRVQGNALLQHVGLLLRQVSGGFEAFPLFVVIGKPLCQLRILAQRRGGDLLAACHHRRKGEDAPHSRGDRLPVRRADKRIAAERYHGRADC